MRLNNELLMVENGNVSYLMYRKLNEFGVVNAFSLKGLNFRNRPEIHIDYEQLLNTMKIDYKKLVKPNQKHTDHILILSQKQNQDTADINLDYLEAIDGIITNQRNIAIATTSADCLCVVLYDVSKKVIANIHSGWRGTFQKIIQKALINMKHEFNCNPEDIFAFFMPAIRQCHFEVDEDVMLECKRIFNYTGKIEEIIKLGRQVEGKQKYNIDNILINQLLLQEEGILSKNIYDSGLCSVCNSEKIHSRRADGENFGLGTTVVMIK